MSRSVHGAARAIHRNSIAGELLAPRTTEPKVAADCRRAAIRSNQAETQADHMPQAGSATLALIDEVFVYLGWKQEYVAGLLGIDPPRFSRAMNEKDQRVFDVRWFDTLDLHPEFRAAYDYVRGKKYGITRESLVELLMQQACSHLAFIRKMLERTAVSE